MCQITSTSLKRKFVDLFQICNAIWIAMDLFEIENVRMKFKRKSKQQNRDWKERKKKMSPLYRIGSIEFSQQASLEKYFTNWNLLYYTRRCLQYTCCSEFTRAFAEWKYLSVKYFVNKFGIKTDYRKFWSRTWEIKRTQTARKFSPGRVKRFCQRKIRTKNVFKTCWFHNLLTKFTFWDQIPKKMKYCVTRKRLSKIFKCKNNQELKMCC